VNPGAVVDRFSGIGCPRDRFVKNVSPVDWRQPV
jgi:hypothetical protein